MIPASTAGRPAARMAALVLRLADDAHPARWPSRRSSTCGAPSTCPAAPTSRRSPPADEPGHVLVGGATPPRASCGRAQGVLVLGATGQRWHDGGPGGQAAAARRRWSAPGATRERLGALLALGADEVVAAAPATRPPTPTRRWAGRAARSTSSWTDLVETPARHAIDGAPGAAIPQPRGWTGSRSAPWPAGTSSCPRPRCDRRTCACWAPARARSRRRLIWPSCPPWSRRSIPARSRSRWRWRRSADAAGGLAGPAGAAGRAPPGAGPCSPGLGRLAQGHRSSQPGAGSCAERSRWVRPLAQVART